MDGLAAQILARFEARAEQIASEIADASIAEVEGFGPMRDAVLREEIRALARQHLEAFLLTARDGGPPPAEILKAARERAATRARETVPLSALLHSYLIAQRVISTAIAAEAGPDARSRGAAFELMGRTFDYNIAVAAAMAEAYVEVVQGDLADVESARRGLVETLLTSGSGDGPELTRRAISLGFDPQRNYVVALAVVEGSADPALPPGNRWAAQAIVRASGLPERSAFVVSRETECVALLDPAGPHPAGRVLATAVAAVRQQHGGSLLAGVGTPFNGLAGFPGSFQAARRALRHATASRRVIQGLADIRLFDELTVADGADAVALILDRAGAQAGPPR
jgi:hypothetical protein